MPDLIAFRNTPLDVAEAVAHVTCPEAGGISVFVGTTRRDFHPQLGALAALDYAAYEEMALAKLTDIVATARQRWGVCRAVVLHRLGRCAVGEASVVIAVACPHRAEAFDACRYVIDELKKLAPIWKQDVYALGSQWRHDAPQA